MKLTDIDGNFDPRNHDEEEFDELSVSFWKLYAVGTRRRLIKLWLFCVNTASKASNDTQHRVCNFFQSLIFSKLA
jgi:hypothetical protein